MRSGSGLERSTRIIASKCGRIAGSVLYLVGAVGVTAAYNVPLNNALAGLDPAAPGTDAAWRDYLSRWTAGNHVRALACLAAAALYTWALTAGEE